MHSLSLPLRPLTRAAALISRSCRAGTPPSITASRAILQPIQARHASILGSLSDNRGAYNKRIRRGRGPASGKGKTSGRGHKGQKQHGKVPVGFQGGQTPLEKVKGKRGFVNFFSVDMSLVNLDRLQHWIDQGRLDPGRHITLKELKETRCVHRIKDGVKLLANDANVLRQPVHITVSRASASAIAAVERAGGSVTTRFYTRPSIKRILAGETHPTLSLMSASASAISDSDSAAQSHEASLAAAPAEAAASLAAAYPPPSAYPYRLPDASSRRDIEYYRDIAHRGYLSHLVEPGAGPSLFFKTPAQMAEQAETKTRKKKTSGAGAASANKLF